MRERVTFVHPPHVGIEPETLEVQDAGILGPQVDAVRQDRFIAAPEDLPDQVASLLGDFEEVHVRWNSPLQYETLDPFSSRLSPGFHLSYTPSEGSTNDPHKLCALLESFGPLECKSPEAFTAGNTEGPSHSPAFYFYQQLEDLHSFITYSMQNVCPELDSICQARIRSLYTASSLDISMDANSKGLVMTAFWPFRPQHIAVPASNNRRIEVGILARDVPAHIEAHELGVSGILTVLGEQKKPSPTLFTFASRHRQSDDFFSSRFLAPAGLHPTLQLSISSNQPPAKDAGCSPYAYLTLPKTIFADRYQLADELFLASKNLSASRYTSLPVDLEAPAYTTEIWGSNVLLELSPPHSPTSESWTAEVPLHLRYLKPSKTGETNIEVPYPVVFWACSSGVDDLESAFDRARLGYDGLFAPDTVFWHAAPRPESGNRVMNSVTVPVLKNETAAWIGFGTAIAVGVGFAWVIWKLVDVLMGPDGQPPPKNQKAGIKTE